MGNKQTEWKTKKQTRNKKNFNRMTFCGQRGLSKAPQLGSRSPREFEVSQGRNNKQKSFSGSI